MAQRLEKDQLRLYKLIWKRTVACQMESAVLDQVAVDVGAGTVGAGGALSRTAGATSANNVAGGAVSITAGAGSSTTGGQGGQLQEGRKGKPLSGLGAGEHRLPVLELSGPRRRLG